MIKSLRNPSWIAQAFYMQGTRALYVENILHGDFQAILEKEAAPNGMPH